jgi:methionyl-tRNA formyltransferase
MDYRFIFFGTPRFSVKVLEALEVHGLVPTLVVTAPDRPRGRGMEVQPSPTKEWALARGIDVLTPQTLKDENLVAELGNTEWDFFATAAYGLILPKSVLDLPRKGSLNVHPSLLPKFRGPSPVLSAILADARETGVSIMLMDEKMDEGPVLMQARIEIDQEDWPMHGSVLEDLLATEGGNLLAETIPQWMDEALTPEPQDHEKATYTKKFSPKDAQIDPAGDPYENLRKIRAFDRNPRAHMIDESGTRLIITDAEAVDGTLEILRVIPEGKKEMAYEEYLRSVGS